ncbi:Rab3 GTPase-activating protein catalytic subunit [Striga asiatica]|uniref:Rab3 GTPase-activating protein catalytic subunit n=1 Tax=Striga asiatica TaxID=4170 RepID=A0A5A7RED2_STRAF|nr:Rab3 GTPase-activating protein catalytic subunit [Striga asiatica]
MCRRKMEALSRARTAINSAAAKAEKVFTDIKKSDSATHRHLDKRSPGSSTPETPKDTDESKDSHEAKIKGVRPRPIKTKADWHERFRNIRIGKRGAEDSEKPDHSTMAYAIFDENLYMMGEREFSNSKDAEEGAAGEGSKTVNKDIIPSSAIVKQLAIAVEAGVNYSSMKELLVSSRGSSPIRERASLSFSAMKSLVLREKDDKLTNEFGGDEKVLAEGHFTGRAVFGPELQANATFLLKDIHGAPIESFVVKLSEAVGFLKTLRKMAAFWARVVAELRRLWYEEQYIPGIPTDDIPDLNSCLLYQQLQVINCCISRKKRHTAAVESLESVTVRAISKSEGSLDSSSTLPLDPCLYAKTKSGERVLRLGADRECENLTMLETGEPVYSPVLQEPPLLTEDLIKETEEFVLRTGSVGAGCSQLLSDMQAFKAANPGCILEDFVRWHSPPDWMENETSNDTDDISDGSDLSIVKGQLSMRMQKEGNLWRELWDTSKPVPAVRQSPLYDEDLAVEGILNHLDEISPSELFKQLFVAALGSGLVIAEATLSTNSSLSSFFDECKNYIVLTCQGDTWMEKLDDICQVYETVETMVLNQDEAIKITVQPEEISPADEMKNRFKKLSLIFGGKNKSSSKAVPSKSLKDSNTEDSPVRQPLSSIFSKKPPKPIASPSDNKTCGSVDNDWTIV